MLTVGDQFPDFKLEAVVSLDRGKEFQKLTRDSFPEKWKVMLADVKRELSNALGVLHKYDGVALRATFIVDPNHVIRHVSVNDLSVGRSVDEVLRILDALQTDELCPCNWQRGQPTLEVA